MLNLLINVEENTFHKNILQGMQQLKYIFTYLYIPIATQQVSHNLAKCLLKYTILGERRDSTKRQKYVFMLNMLNELYLVIFGLFYFWYHSSWWRSCYPLLQYFPGQGTNSSRDKQETLCRNKQLHGRYTGKKWACLHGKQT